MVADWVWEGGESAFEAGRGKSHGDPGFLPGCEEVGILFRSPLGSGGDGHCLGGEPLLWA